MLGIWQRWPCPARIDIKCSTGTQCLSSASRLVSDSVDAVVAENKVQHSQPTLPEYEAASLRLFLRVRAPLARGRAGHFRCGHSLRGGAAIRCSSSAREARGRRGSRGFWWRQISLRRCSSAHRVIFQHVLKCTLIIPTPRRPKGCVREMTMRAFRVVGTSPRRRRARVGITP